MRAEILSGLTALDFDITLQISDSADHLRRLAIESLQHPERPLLCAGGDGSNRIVVDALLSAAEGKTLPTLGLIPAGRGNSFLRDLGIESLPEALEAIAAGKTLAVDVARFSSCSRHSHFINCLGVGFISDVGLQAARLRRLGNISYALGVLWEMLLLRHHRLSIEIDGQTIKENLIFVEVSNSRMTGGSMLIAPEARIDDGQLDVVRVRRIGRYRLLRTFPKIYSGTHGTNPDVLFQRGQKIHIDSPSGERLLPDGDLEFETPVDISVLPGRINCFFRPLPNQSTQE